MDGPDFKESMVYIPDTCCFNGFFDIERVCSLMKLGFDKFDEHEFKCLCKEFDLLKDDKLTSNKISTMSTGNQMKLMLCAMLARDGKYLLLDELAANLDPVMQDLLQLKMRDYLKDEEHTIIYSTHNIEQVHNVADYAIFMCDGKVIESGLIIDICEKYRIIRGNAKDLEQISSSLDYAQVREDVFDGLGKTEVIASLHGDLDITIEKPELRDLSVYLLKMGRDHV